jgi:hypothetical protein
MDKGFFTVVGYNKENNAYIEYDDFELSIEAEMYAKELNKMLDNGELNMPVDWFEVVQTDNYDVVYWLSYEENE